jgi:hypothetical protein
MTSRRGISLVEMLIVMTGCSTILTLSGVLLNRAMQAQLQTRDYFDGERTALRLADQWRRDVHATRDARTDPADLPEGVFLRLELPDGQTVDYRRTDAGILRTVAGDGAVATREQYRFAPIGEIAVNELASPRRLRLTIAAPYEKARGSDSPAALSHQSPISLQVEAVLGRDRRLAVGDSGDQEERAP